MKRGVWIVGGGVALGAVLGLAWWSLSSKGNAPSTDVGAVTSAPRVTLGEPLAARGPRQIALRLDRSPPELQTRLVRELEQAPVEERVAALGSFLRQPRHLHAGAVLESVLQLRRAGPPGARVLLDAYPTLDPLRREVVLQAFEATRTAADRDVLSTFTPATDDPLRQRWLALGTS